MKPKIIVVVAAAFSHAAVLFGCGGGSAPPAETEEQRMAREAKEKAEEAAEAAAKKAAEEEATRKAKAQAAAASTAHNGQWYLQEIEFTDCPNDPRDCQKKPGGFSDWVDPGRVIPEIRVQVRQPVGAGFGANPAPPANPAPANPANPAPANPAGAGFAGVWPCCRGKKTPGKVPNNFMGSRKERKLWWNLYLWKLQRDNRFSFNPEYTDRPRWEDRWWTWGITGPKKDRSKFTSRKVSKNVSVSEPKAMMLRADKFGEQFHNAVTQLTVEYTGNSKGSLPINRQETQKEKGEKGCAKYILWNQIEQGTDHFLLVTPTAMAKTPAPKGDAETETIYNHLKTYRGNDVKALPYKSEDLSDPQKKDGIDVQAVYNGIVRVWMPDDKNNRWIRARFAHPPQQ